MNIVVLAGGTSTEREISLVSGTGVASALRERGHRAVLVDPFAGVETVNREDPFPEQYDVKAQAEIFHAFNHRVKEIRKRRRSFWGPNVLWLCEQADVVFLALHGMNGEDGRVQATFDLMGIPYTGAGYLASGNAMNKAITKQIFMFNGVSTPKGVTFGEKTRKSVKELGMRFPLVVKTCCGGSSVGVYIVHNEDEYEAAVSRALELEESVVVEEYITGREFTAAVVDGKAYPVVEIIPREGFYDYKNKYEPGATTEICPARISEALTKRIQKSALKAAKSLQVTTLSRMDFIVTEDEEIYCLEANTLPGMTPTSLIPQEAAAAGMDYGELCEELIRVSLEKYR